MEEQSLKVQPSAKLVLDASPAAPTPSKPNALMQVADIHPLYNSELNYRNHQHNLSMQMLRKYEGLGVPLRMTMDLRAARQIGRLPFLKSSNLMEDVLLGRDEEIDFDDVFNQPENREFMYQPHMVVEKSLGIL